jgi:beta-N-acetylhexosaminidase
MERLEQLAHGCVLASFAGPVVPDWLCRAAADGLGGVVLFADNIVDGEQLGELTARLHGARTGFVVATDEEGGDVTRLEARTGSSYPSPAALGALDDVSATEAVAQSLGRRLRSVGIDLDLAPCADVNCDPVNPVIGVRSFGASPEVVSRHVAAFVSGIQRAGVASCLKHFPGHGDTSVDSHLDLPVVEAPVEVLARRELVPFRSGIEAGAVGVMTSHLVVRALDDRPATVCRRILVDLLRRELGFTGVVISDALDMAGVSRDVGIPAAAVAALAAGADLLCVGARKDEVLLDAVVAAIVAAVQVGELTEERLVEAAGPHRLALPVVDGPPEPDAHEIARRAMSVDGPPLAPLRHTVVVTCRPPTGIAVGDVPWGIAAPLRALDPSVVSHDVDRPAGADGLAREAGERPVVVVVRDAHRQRWQREVIAAVERVRPDVIVVEMGWPGEPAPITSERGTYIRTYGASRVTGEALARVLYEGGT